MVRSTKHTRLENPDNPAEALCELCATAWPCEITELRAKLEQYQAEFREQITEEHAAYQEQQREIKRLRAALAFTRTTAVELFRAGLVESLDAGVRLLDGPLDPEFRPFKIDPR